MIVLGFDTATSATAVALRFPDGSVLERRDDPSAGERPGHATRLLAMVDELLRASGTPWSALGRIAVGVGPGTFTGLRVGLATAHGLACSRSLELVGVSSLRALALPALADGPGRPGPGAGAGGGAGDGTAAVLAVIDARRGEVFAAGYEGGEDGLPRQLGPAAVLAPEGLPGLLADLGGAAGAAGATGAVSWTVVGDGAVRYGELLAAADLSGPAADSPLHRVAAGAVCELGFRAEAPSRGSVVLPDYLRRPDAELALEGAA
jgi:tRNA threonylcarbamoyladenosine biosynthesis protein TsaB